MKKFTKWFTAERRQLIQVFLGSLAPVFILLGFATQNQTEQYLVISGAVLQFFASLLSLINLRGVLSIWTALRGAIYTFGFTVSPVLVILGVYDESTNQYILMGISLGLGALSNLVAIFVGKSQEVAELKHTIEVKEKTIDTLEATRN